MKKSWDIATTDPMKKPTAMELWNFRIIIVPPMLNTRSISADQIDANPSARVRVDMTTKLSNVRIAVTAKIEYLIEQAS
jgi:hypothetical protein